MTWPNFKIQPRPLCTHSWEGIKRFHHAYDGTYKGTYPYSEEDLDENTEIKDSMTLHHVKVPWVMYRIHRYFLKRNFNNFPSPLSSNVYANSDQIKISIDRFISLYENSKIDQADHQLNSSVQQSINSHCKNSLLQFYSNYFIDYGFNLQPLSYSSSNLNSNLLLLELIKVSEQIYDILFKSLRVWEVIFWEPLAWAAF